MKIYKTKVLKLTGTDFKEIHQKAVLFYNKIKRKTKRRPYIRSAYFKKNKIFLGLFWSHLYEKKHYKNQIRRMKYLPCAIELIRHSNSEPISKENPNRRHEILHRFAGSTKEDDLFSVHIKENKKTGQKFLISVFPTRKQKRLSANCSV